jgi:hypothetical protein
VRSLADGTLSAEKTVKIDVNGYVTGYGLAVTAGASGPVQSAFTILADRFNFAMPGVIGPTAVVTVGNVNGIPTFGINGNLVVDGTIVTRHLIDASVTTPKLQPGSATRFASGSAFSLGMSVGVNVTAAQAILDVQDGYVGAPANAPPIPIEVEWSCAVFHSVNQDPSNAVQVWLEYAPPGAGFSLLQGTFIPNSRNFLGEIYPGFLRKVAFPVITRGIYQFRVIVRQINGSGYDMRESYLTAKATLR